MNSFFIEFLNGLHLLFSLWPYPSGVHLLAAVLVGLEYQCDLGTLSCSLLQQIQQQQKPQEHISFRTQITLW